MPLATLVTLISLVSRVAASLAVASAVHAASIEVSPIRIELGPNQRSATVTVRNSGPEPVLVQAEVLRWSQASGEDKYEPTREVIVTPTVITVPGRAEQIVRVAVRRDLDPAQELAYRLYVQEVPQERTASAERAFALQVALRIGIPLFVAPAAGKPEPKLAWKVRREGERWVLSAANAGTASVRLAETRLITADGNTLGEQPDLAYVLPGQTRNWPLRAADGGTTAPPVPPLRVRALSHLGAIDDAVALDPN